MNHQLENKRALVTGGSRGIGAAIVRRLAREGTEAWRAGQEFLSPGAGVWQFQLYLQNGGNIPKELLD